MHDAPSGGPHKTLDGNASTDELPVTDADGPEVRWMMATPDGSTASTQAEGRVYGRVEHTDGRPFGGVPITVTTDLGDPVAVVSSGADGSFDVSVETGAYIVIASPTGCQPDALRTWVPAGGEGESLDFVLDGDGLLYGRVRGATEGVVTLLDADGSVVAGSDIADDGSYEIAGLRRGVYTATTMVPGTAPVAHQVEVLPGEAREHDLGLGPADLSGTYRSEDISEDLSQADDGHAPGLHPVTVVYGGTGISDLPIGTGAAGTPAAETNGSAGNAAGPAEEPEADGGDGFASAPDRENN